MRDGRARTESDAWAEAEEARREAMRDASPAERLELLEEIVEMAFSAQELNPRLRTREARALPGSGDRS